MFASPWTVDALEGCDQVQKLALELLGHLAAMAEDMSPFEPQQVMEFDLLV